MRNENGGNRRAMKEKRAFKWIGETDFMFQFLSRFQRILDEGTIDYRLEFWDTCTLPKKSWQIAMEFPEGSKVWDAKGLDSVREELLDNFFNSDKELKEAVNIFSQCMKHKRNGATIVPMACVLCDECDKGRGPGVIIYWV